MKLIKLSKYIFVALSLLVRSPVYSSESPEANSESTIARSLAEFKHEMLGADGNITKYRNALEEIIYCLEQTEEIEKYLSKYINAIRTALKIVPTHGSYDSFATNKTAVPSKDDLNRENLHSYIVQTPDGISAIMQIVQISKRLETTNSTQNGVKKNIKIDMTDPEIMDLANSFLRDKNIDVSHLGAACLYSATKQTCFDFTISLFNPVEFSLKKLKIMEPRTRQFVELTLVNMTKLFDILKNYSSTKIQDTCKSLNFYGPKEKILVKEFSQIEEKFNASRPIRKQLYELIYKELLDIADEQPGLNPEQPKESTSPKSSPPQKKAKSKKKPGKVKHGSPKHRKASKPLQPKPINFDFDETLSETEEQSEEPSSAEESPRDRFEIEYENNESLVKNIEPKHSTTNSTPKMFAPTTPAIPSKYVKLEDRVFKKFRTKMALHKSKKAGSDRNLVDHSPAFDIVLRMLGHEGIRVKYRNRTFDKVDMVYALPCEMNYNDGSKPRHGLVSMALDTEDGNLYRVYHYGFSEKPVEELTAIGFTKKLIEGLTQSESNGNVNLGYIQTLEEMYEPEERKKFLFHLPERDLSTVVSESKFTRTINDPANNAEITVYRPAKNNFQGKLS